VPRGRVPRRARHTNERRFAPPARRSPQGTHEQRTYDGWLPLHLAAAYVQSEAVRCLADACPGALEERTPEGWLPLHLAARYANVDVVQFLANKRPGTLEQRTYDGWLPLHVAARHAKSEVVEWLASTSRSALAEKTDCGRYPLHLAARRGCDRIVCLLAAAFPQALHEPASDGFLPLHNAACNDAPLDVVFDLARMAAGAIGLPPPRRRCCTHVTAARIPHISALRRLEPKSLDRWNSVRPCTRPYLPSLGGRLASRTRIGAGQKTMAMPLRRNLFLLLLCFASNSVRVGTTASDPDEVGGEAGQKNTYKNDFEQVCGRRKEAVVGVRQRPPGPSTQSSEVGRVPAERSPG
jgi:Ankyrin repeats (3 copies)